MVPTDEVGANEGTPPAPVGEYAWSVLARERMFEDASARHGTAVSCVRINYAAEMRYGVPVELALKVMHGRPVDLSMGWFNVIWQGDANARALASFALAAAPPRLINLTGPEKVSVRDLALKFAEHFGREPVFAGEEQATALLSDAARSVAHFGPPSVSLDRLVRWVADWVERGGETWDKPTHFEIRDGAF